MTTSILPSLENYDNHGTLFVKEFEFSDGCNKIRRLPLVIINRPTKVIIPSNDCKTPSLQYTEWASSAQLFRNSEGEKGCLDHVISIRISMSTGSNPAVIVNNVNTFLEMFRNAPSPSLALGTL